MMAEQNQNCRTRMYSFSCFLTSLPPYLSSEPSIVPSSRHSLPLFFPLCQCLSFLLRPAWCSVLNRIDKPSSYKSNIDKSRYRREVPASAFEFVVPEL